MKLMVFAEVVCPLKVCIPDFGWYIVDGLGKPFVLEKSA